MTPFPRVATFIAVVAAALTACAAYYEEYSAHTKAARYTSPSPKPTPAEKKEYRVHEVLDGKTLQVWKDGRLVTVKLKGIEVSDPKTTSGHWSKHELEKLERKSITLDECKERDRQGNIVADVYYKGESVAERQMGKGQARRDRSVRPCTQANSSACRHDDKGVKK